MEITDVKIFPVNEDKLKAFVSIILDNCFVISDIKIIHGSNGLFVSMPSKKRKNGTFRDIAHPLNNETRRKMEERIFQEYYGSVADARGDVEPRSLSDATGQVGESGEEKPGAAPEATGQTDASPVEQAGPERSEYGAGEGTGEAGAEPSPETQAEPWPGNSGAAPEREGEPSDPG